MSGRVNLDPVRRAEASLLLSDLVTMMLPVAARDGSPITVTIDEGPASVVVSVTDGLAEAPRIDELATSVLDRMARRWGVENEATGGRIWFEIRRPGTVAPALSALESADLLALAASNLDARDEVIRRFTPLALGQARRYRGKGIADADLEQVALLGMLRALERYDPDIGPFEPYAARTISGELKRHFRDRAWSVRVPRTLQEHVLDVTRAGQELGQRLGRWPTPAEIATHLDLDVESVVEAMGAMRAYSSVSLEAPDDDTGWTVADGLGAEDADLVLADRWHGLAPALQALPERERRILYLRFFEEKTQSEIAELIGISQMHVSRLLARALEKLRATAE
jgi:RNA polymerase sigma-B factor